MGVVVSIIRKEVSAADRDREPQYLELLIEWNLRQFEIRRRKDAIERLSRVLHDKHFYYALVAVTAYAPADQRFGFRASHVSARRLHTIFGRLRRQAFFNAYDLDAKRGVETLRLASNLILNLAVGIAIEMRERHHVSKRNASDFRHPAANNGLPVARIARAGVGTASHRK
jgi:hypothetical protein